MPCDSAALKTTVRRILVSVHIPKQTNTRKTWVKLEIGKLTLSAQDLMMYCDVKKEIATVKYDTNGNIGERKTIINNMKMKIAAIISVF